MEEWKSYKLSDICDLIPGFAFKSADFGDYSTKAIKIGDIQPPYVSRASMSGVNINMYDKNKLSKFLVKRGDFVLAMTGATIGKIGKYIDYEPAYLNQRVLLFKPHKNVNPHFVYYSLLSPLFQKYVINHIDSETAQPNISSRSVSGFEIALPCKEVQDRIVSILSSIDEKIEVNNRINHNLEEQAQALYKSWFVDFEPFKGGKYVDSEVGFIPNGWRVGMLSELVEVRYGKDHKMLKDGKIPVYGSGGLMRYADRALFGSESVLIPRKGTLNNVMYVDHPFWTVDTMFYTIGKIEHVVKYAHLFLLTQDLASMNAGSAVPSMTTDILNKLPVLIPTCEVLRDFDAIVSALYLEIGRDRAENASLASSRDSILPKLMSGAIDFNMLNC
jgi:type I restriction enzyme S subunit